MGFGNRTPSEDWSAHFRNSEGLLDDAMVAAIEHNGGVVPTKRGYASSDRLRDAIKAAYGPLAGDMTLLETPALPNPVAPSSP